MRHTQIIRRNLALSVIVLALAVLLSAGAAHHPPQAPAAAANEMVLTVDPAQSSVHYTISSSLHTVHGTFAVKGGSLRIDPATGRASGEVVVDAASGQSGNDSRDKKMHKEVLESTRFTEITFHPDHLEGAIQSQGSSTAQLHGSFVLHGGEHQITVPVQAELKSDQWKGTAQFSIPYNDWGLKNPGNFLLRVDHAVNIEADLVGSFQPQSAQSKP